MTMDRFLRARDVARMVGLSQTTLWRLGRTGEFPLPLRITQGRKAWSERAVLEWMESRAVRLPKAAAKPPTRGGVEAEIAGLVRRTFALPRALQAKVNYLEDDVWLAVRSLRRCSEIDAQEFNSRDMLRRMPAPKPTARDMDAACGVLVAVGAVAPVAARTGGRPRKDFRIAK